MKYHRLLSYVDYIKQEVARRALNGVPDANKRSSFRTRTIASSNLMYAYVYAHVHVQYVVVSCDH